MLLIHMASNFAPVTAAPRPPPDGPRRKGRWHQRAFCWEALAPPPDQTPSRRPIVHHPPPPAHCCTLTFGTTKEYARWRAIQDTKPLPLRCSIAAFYAQSPAKAEHTHTHTHTRNHTHTHTHTHTRHEVCSSRNTGHKLLQRQVVAARITNIYTNLRYGCLQSENLLQKHHAAFTMTHKIKSTCSTPPLHLQPSL